jgi:sialidase-1
MDEATMTQLTNGSVVVNMRHQAAKTEGRGVAMSQDNGDTWGALRYDTALISPVCQGSLVTFGGSTYFSNPESTTGRDHIGVRRSDDNMQSWGAKPHLIETSGSAGYSCLVAGPLHGSSKAPLGGILFESIGSGNIAFSTFPAKF